MGRGSLKARLAIAWVLGLGIALLGGPLAENAAQLQGQKVLTAEKQEALEMPFFSFGNSGE